MMRWLRWIRVLDGTAVPDERRRAVREAIARTGRWEHHEEWRISTVTSLLIERTGESGYRTYRVRVECDYVLEAHCPTLARAIEIAHIYEQLIPRLWQTYGWPSWASLTRLEGTDDGTL